MTGASRTGRLGTTGRQLESRSPQLPSRLLASFPEASGEEVHVAVSLARRAQREWARLPAPERAAALGRAASAVEGASKDLTELGIAEVGKPRSEMAAEVQRGVAILRYYAGAALDPDGDSLPSPDGRSLLWSRRLPQEI